MVQLLRIVHLREESIVMKLRIVAPVGKMPQNCRVCGKVFKRGEKYYSPYRQSKWGTSGKSKIWCHYCITLSPQS